MPTAPNYGLIGLAQGAGSMPESMASGQNTALALKLRGIQAQEAQRQLSEQQAEDVAGSMSISPKMQTVPGTPAQYGPAPTPSPQTSSTGEGEPLNAPPQAIPRGEGEPIPPQVQTQAATPETQKEYKFTTPYEQMAYETQQRAERLRSMGMGRVAMKYQQEAMQYGQMHHDLAMKLAGQAITAGAYQSAIPLLNSAGYGISDIKEDPEDEDHLIIYRQVGGQTQEASIPKITAIMMGADPTKIAETQAMIHWRNATLDINQQRASAYGKRADAYQQRVNDQAENAKNLLEIKKLAPNAPTAVMKNAAAYMKAHPEASYGEALEVFSPGKGKQVSTTAMISALRLANLDMVRQYHGAPMAQTGDPSKWTPEQKEENDDATRFHENRKMMDDWITKAGTTPAPKSPQPTVGPAPVGYKDPRSGLTKQADGTWK